MPSNSYTWIVEQRIDAEHPWRVQAMDTEQSGLDIHVYLGHKREQLSAVWDFTDVNTNLTVSRWKASRQSRPKRAIAEARR